MSAPDLTVVGLGPAGRTLAHRALARGLRVRVVDPRPARLWRNTYGGWAHQLPEWLPDEVVGARSKRTVMRTGAVHVLPEPYLVLDTPRLQQALSIEGAEVVERVVDDAELAALPGAVVDCRGSRPAGVPGGGPAQTAFGLMLPRGWSEKLLRGDEAVLMEWTPHDGRARWGTEEPSFCYLIPLPDGRVLAEETCLAGSPALRSAELERRLGARLDLLGVPEEARRAAEVERVHIPLTHLPRGSGVPPFGAAGDQLNPITGYSVFASLAQADDVLDAVLGGRPVAAPRGTRALRLAALGAVLKLSGDATVQLFDAFARLSVADQRAVMDPATPATELVAALTRQWAAMPGPDRFRLVSATAQGVLRP
ncbi:lycopene cyclase family protein [Aestuariimicrobium sp. p3-SID1156]|uniref:lycopene cyclase family protein n=1 Tax=Aestuariimicrobium sp. p3-SID1156 TaxID=2916038 RepID=UPI00223B26D1|nr:lycopene cyclase family protein [Aestuariimicrobium sp. p3-SID1156]MCT1458060.1 lycopene cyclase family protein [Aestuariimicrobium sp. p3-SID1156]